MSDQTVFNIISIQQAFGEGSSKGYKLFSKLCESGIISLPFNELLKSDPVCNKEPLLGFDTAKTEKIIADCSKNFIEIITPLDAEYPENLRSISAPPLVLYKRGTAHLADCVPLIAVVGPRTLSKFGEKAAYSLARRLSLGGFTVVSGAALGGDTFAHLGALESGNKSVAFLGCGICFDYLPKNRPLRNKIEKNGCLISEYPPFAATTSFSFPLRNRLVSGISEGVVVIEAPEKSGTLITAHDAFKQGRDVYVVPGNPTLKEYKGSNALFAEGAIALTDAKAIFLRYAKKYPEKISLAKAFREKPQKNLKKFQKKSTSGLSKTAEMVYNYLDKQKFIADDLISLNISGGDILSALTELEVEGYIKSMPGGIYELT